MSDSQSSAVSHEPTGHDGQLGHVVPVWLLIGVFLALIALTFLTVAVTWVDLGAWNLVVAMVIAVVKATLVALVFMHLAWDRGFNAVIFLGAIVFLGLFILMTLLDTSEYLPDVRAYEEQQVSASP